MHPQLHRKLRYTLTVRCLIARLFEEEGSIKKKARQ